MSPARTSEGRLRQGEAPSDFHAAAGGLRAQLHDGGQARAGRWGLLGARGRGGLGGWAGGWADGWAAGGPGPAVADPARGLGANADLGADTCPTGRSRREHRPERVRGFSARHPARSAAPAPGPPSPPPSPSPSSSPSSARWAASSARRATSRTGIRSNTATRTASSCSALIRAGSPLHPHRVAADLDLRQLPGRRPPLPGLRPNPERAGLVGQHLAQPPGAAGSHRTLTTYAGRPFLPTTGVTQASSAPCSHQRRHGGAEDLPRDVVHVGLEDQHGLAVPGSGPARSAAVPTTTWTAFGSPSIRGGPAPNPLACDLHGRHRAPPDAQGPSRAAPVGVVSSNGIVGPVRRRTPQQLHHGRGGHREVPCAVWTIPVPCATGLARISSTPSSSRATHVPTMSMMASVPPTSWKWTWAVGRRWRRPSTSAKRAKVARARSRARSGRRASVMSPAIWP